MQLQRRRRRQSRQLRGLFGDRWKGPSGPFFDEREGKKMESEDFKFEVLCAKCDGKSLPGGVDGVIALSKCLDEYTLEELVSLGAQLMLMLNLIREGAKVKVKQDRSAAVAMARKFGMVVEGDEAWEWPEELTEKIN